MTSEYLELRDKIMAGVHESMDKLLLERMAINEPLIVGEGRKVKAVSPFILAEERWGKDFVEKWKRDNNYSR